jgi:nicotinamide-nucleotide amidase
VHDPLVTDDARALVADLTVRRQSVATAESLTAGLLAATLAGVPGASVVLRGGLVTYVEDTKIALAGVAPQLLDAVGPVAAPTAAWRSPGRDGVRGAGRADRHRGRPAGVFRITLGHPGRGGARGDRAAAGIGRATVICAIDFETHPRIREPTRRRPALP